MMGPQYERRRQHGVVIVALLLFGLVLLLIQIWLFVMVLENLLGGKTAAAVPAAIASCVLLAINAWMLRGVTSFARLK